MASRKVKHGVRWALLGVMAQYPGRYGYDYAQRVELLLGESARISAGLVYTSLNSLEEQGLIREVGDRRQGTRSPQKSYEVTDEGIEALTEWLRDHYFEPVRWDLPAKLALIRPDQTDAMLAAIDAAEDECMTMQRRLADRVAEASGDPWHGPFIRLAYKYGSTQLDGRLAWLQLAREAIEEQSEALRDGRIRFRRE